MSNSKRILLFPLLLVLYEIATYLSNDMYLPALPIMMQDLHLTAQQAQLTLTTWFLGQASMPFLLGPLSDRYGRRPVLLIGGLVYIVSTILCAMTTSREIFQIGRFIEGAMVTAMLVPGYACIHELFDKKEAIRMLALMGSISVLAPAVGPLAGGVILSLADWRAIFWVIAGISVVAIFLLYHFMPETLTEQNRQPIHFKSLAKSYARVFTNAQFMMLMCVLGLMFTGFIAWITAGSLLVIESFHYSAVAFGVIQAIIFAAYILGNRLVKILMDKIGVALLIRVGLMTTLTGGLLMFYQAVQSPDSLYAFLTGMTIYSFGASLCFSPLNRSIIESSSELMGIRVAVFTIFLTIFGSLGSALASFYFTGTIASLAYIIAAVSVVSCFIMLITVLLPKDSKVDWSEGKLEVAASETQQ